MMDQILQAIGDFFVNIWNGINEGLTGIAICVCIIGVYAYMLGLKKWGPRLIWGSILGSLIVGVLKGGA